jgi:predicted transcriptional regulator of viral defense system
MKWREFLEQFSDSPLFHSSMLQIFSEPKSHLQVQLSRWVDTKKLIQIRRGWYLIAQPFRFHEVPPEVIANKVVSPSYISLESALSFYGLIPEETPNPTSVTTTRAENFHTAGRLFIYQHIKPDYFRGFLKVKFGDHEILIASPEKALWDKMYLHSLNHRFSIEWLEELRLQNLEEFNLSKWEEYSSMTPLAYINRASKIVFRFIQEVR